MDGRRYLKSCGLAALGLIFGIAAASAQDKPIELKLSHWVPPSHPLQAAIQDWADEWLHHLQDLSGTAAWQSVRSL
jgi:TRAP-type C4-dicarboxylate transport system substrate-binding protein